LPTFDFFEFDIDSVAFANEALFYYSQRVTFSPFKTTSNMLDNKNINN